MAEHFIPVKVVDYPDLRPVVLCRDCRHAYYSVSGWCCSYGVCVDCTVRDDFYCADGEKDVRPVERRKDCRNLLDYESLFECSNCGWTSSDTYVADQMRYCPGCGARIVKQEVRDG